jgi:hypothetical protein
MWTMTIFFGTVFASIAFLLWFLAGLIREEISSHRAVVLSSLRHSKSTRLVLREQKTAVQREQDSVTVRLVSWYGASAQEGKPTCGISSSYL